MSTSSPLDDPLPTRWTNDYEQGSTAPPDTSMINGRPTQEWERPRIRAAKLDARERAAALVARAR